MRAPELTLNERLVEIQYNTDRTKTRLRFVGSARFFLIGYALDDMPPRGGEATLMVTLQRSPNKIIYKRTYARYEDALEDYENDALALLE